MQGAKPPQGGFCIYGGLLKTYAYVDGFNLYYRALKGTQCKWLNIDALLRIVYPKNTIICIRYFTANVKPLPHDPNQPTRQRVYLRALRTLPNVKIHLGQFTSHEVRLPMVSTLGTNAVRFARVLKSEEKGSDVNLAAHLVNDAHLGRFEAAIVVTNDSDLIEPIRIVTQGVGLPVGVLNPCSQPAGGLRRAATFYTVLRKNIPSRCQFPAQMNDKGGSFQKPQTW